MLKRLGNKQFLLQLVKRMIVGTLLPAFLLCFCFKAFATGNQDWSTEREEIIHRQDELNIEEQKLLSELRELQIKAEALKLKLDNLAQQIVNHNQRMKELNKDLDTLKIDLQTARQELVKIIRNYYYTGSYAYLEVIFDAQSWGDMLIRFEMINRLVAHNQKHIAAVIKLENQLASTRSELEQEKREAQQAYEEQKEQSELLAQAQLEKEQALNHAQSVSQELYQKLLQVEQSWSSVFPAIDTLLLSLPELPWFSVTPDRVHFDFLTGQMIIEVSEKTLNSHFSKLNSKLASIKVLVEQDQLTLRCVEEFPVDLIGSLVMENKAVRFEPETLVIDGLPVQKETISLLTKEYDLFLDISKVQSGYSLAKIELLPGMIRFRVNMN